MKRNLIRLLLTVTFPVWAFPVFVWEIVGDKMTEWAHRRNRKRARKAQERIPW